MKLLFFFSLISCITLYCMEQKSNVAQKLLKYAHYDPDALLLNQKKGIKAKVWVNQNKALAINIALDTIREKYPELKDIHVAPNVLNMMIATQEQTKKIQRKIERLGKKYNT